MKYKIKISGGITGIIRNFEGELSKQSIELQKSLLSEKIMLKINPKLRDGYLYKISLNEGKKSKEFIIDESYLTDSLKELVEIATSKKVA